MIRRWLAELRDYIRSPRGIPDRVSESIRDEIVFHITESAAREIEAGAPIENAHFAAIDKFGDVTGVVRECATDAADVHSRWHRRHLAATAVLLVGVVAGSVWAVRAMNAPPWIGDGDVTGRVVDDAGEPIADAHVLAVVKTWPKLAFRQLAYTAVTDADGRYRIDDVYPLDEKYEVQLAVIADQRLLQSAYVDLQSGPLTPIDFKLRATTPMVVRFESTNGQPIAGVEVFPSERVDASGERHTIYFCSGAPIIARSDEAGRVSLPYFSPGDRVAFYVREPFGEWRTEELTVDSAGEIVVRVPRDS